MKKPLRKWTAAWVAVTFIWMAMGIVFPGQLKAGSAKAGGTTSTVEATKERNAETSSFEKEGTTPEIVKKKKFPWLWVAAGVVVAGVIVYFTLIKKPKYELTVEIGAGVTGSPTAGKYTYKKGQRITYNFVCADGYKNLTVLLNDKPASTSGTLVMDRACNLKATATKLSEYSLTVDVENEISGTPATGTYKYREGMTVSYQYTAADPALTVTLDDISVAKSGSFTMDKDHVLKAQIAYVLTVNVESGISGTPEAGTYRYKKGATVDYQYSISQGIYFAKLDGNPVLPSGSFKMNGDRILIISKGQLPDLRGKWAIKFPSGPDLIVSFSGEKTIGDVILLEDPTSFWEFQFLLEIGRIGDYAVSSTQVQLEINGGVDTIYLWGFFTSTNSMTGHFYYITRDPPVRIEGTWTAARIK